MTPEQLGGLCVSADRGPFDGDARMFRRGIEAQRLGLAYEYDPFFSRSIARVASFPSSGLGTRDLWGEFSS